MTSGIFSPTSDEQTSLSHVLHRKVQKMFLHLYHDLSFQCDMDANVLAIYERWGQETQGEKKLADPNWGSLIVTDSDIIRTSGLVQGWAGKLFFSRGGAGRGEARQKIYGRGRGGDPPLPHNAGRGGEGVKICGVGRGQGGEHTACIS